MKTSTNLMAALAALILMGSASAAGAGIPGSSMSGGGDGHTLGVMLAGEGSGAAREVLLAPREGPALQLTGHGGDVALMSQALAQGDAVLRWRRVTAKDDSVPDLSWGYFTLPLDVAQAVDLSRQKELELWVKPEQLAGVELSAQLVDATGKEGPMVQLANGATAPLEPGRTRLVALPLEALTAGLDAAKVRALRLHIGGDYAQNTEITWRVERVAATAQPVPGLRRVGCIDLGGKLALTWQALPGTQQVRLGNDAHSLSFPAAAGEAIVDRAQLGAGAFSIVALAGTLSSPPVPVPLISNVGAPVATLRYDGPARATAVSPWLLGINGNELSTASAQGARVVRWGGNWTSVYNWKQDVSNASNDWYCLASPHGKTPWTDPRDSRWYSFIKTARDGDMDVNLTIPIAVWIARRPAPDGPQCSYPRSMYPEQQRFSGDGKCGNGRTPDGKYIRMKDRTLTYTHNSVSFQRQWLEEIVKLFGRADQGGVRFISLDNEITLWHSSHFDSCPEGINGPDLVRRNIEYATMIKGVDPSAEVFGFAGWGPVGCAGSDRDYRSGAWADLPKGQKWTEREEVRGGQDLLSWYLDQMKAASAKAGRRLIDGLTINWYPELEYTDPQGRKHSLSNCENQGYDLGMTPVQFDALRYWWDPTYVNQGSWLYIAGDPRKYFWEPYTPVLPKLNAIIQKHYPGTKLAITEYSLGSENRMTGALLQVESVGIFMEYDLFSAQRWFGTHQSSWAYWGNRLLGNYDGQRSSVLGHYRKITSSEPQLKAYATESAGRRHVVLVNENHAHGWRVRLPAAGATSYRVAYLAEPTGQQIVLTPAAQVAGPEVELTLPAFSAAVCIMEVPAR